jgi:hypothetical protein
MEKRLGVVRPATIGRRAAVVKLGRLEFAGFLGWLFWSPDREKGLRRLDEAAQLVDTTQERWAEAEMLRCRGMMLLSIDERAAAEGSYHRALAVAQRQAAKFWELRAALDLAHLWRVQGKRDQAHDLLAPVCGQRGRGHGECRPW